MRRAYLSFRRLLDLTIAVITLVVLSPLFCVVAVVIRLSMGGPVLFKQERVGIRGRTFRILKFRTMVQNAEAIGGGYMPPELNLIPPVGSFLRRTSLDELPQLLNILRGDMSFIGPRPALPDQVRRYTPIQALRLNVPQGLTGLAQVRHRNEAPWSVRIESDLEYVKRLSPFLDLKIFFCTLQKTLSGSGVRLDQTAAQVDDLGLPAEGSTNNE